MANFDKLVDNNAIDTKGDNLGSVKGEEVNAIELKITHLHVKLSGQAVNEIGLKSFRSSTVRVPISLVSAASEVVNLNSALTEISGDPSSAECRE